MRNLNFLKFALVASCLASVCSISRAANVKDVIVHFDDGTEQTLTANAAAPGPDPQPAPAPVDAGALGAQLVNPADASVTCAPGYLMLRAQVSGNPTQVEFFAGDTSIGVSTARPHMVAWREIPAGDYSITAKATDASGATAVSPIAHVSVKPAPTGKTFTAAASGDIARLLPQLSPGDTLLIKAGTYNESVKVSKSGTPDKPIFIRAEEPEKVILQSSAAGTLFAAEGADNLVISGITFSGGGADKQDNDTAAVRVGNGCRVEDCIVQKALGVGLTMHGTGDVFLRTTAQDNARAGMGGTSNKAAMVLDCISRRNNSKGDSNGGGGKFTRSDGVLIQNHQSYQNTGVGIWFDYSNIDCVVRHCEVHHNIDRMKNGKLKSGAAGIFFEISGIVEKSGKEGYLLAEQNYVHDNDREGIQAWGSRNVTIQNNTLVNDSIELRAGRPAPFVLKNITVTGNHLKDTSIGLDGDAIKGFAAARILIDGNTYDLASGPLVRWGSSSYSALADVQKTLNIEASGAAAKIEPPAWAAPAVPPVPQ